MELHDLQNIIKYNLLFYVYFCELVVQYIIYHAGRDSTFYYDFETSSSNVVLGTGAHMASSSSSAKKDGDIFLLAGHNLYKR